MLSTEKSLAYAAGAWSRWNPTWKKQHISRQQVAIPNYYTGPSYSNYLIAKKFS